MVDGTRPGATALAAVPASPHGWRPVTSSPGVARADLARRLATLTPQPSSVQAVAARRGQAMLGETPRRPNLAPQEFQIAGLVASEMTNRQIAAQLYLSPRTIEYHLRKIFTKLRLASRTELVRTGVPSGDADL